MKHHDSLKAEPTSPTWEHKPEIKTPPTEHKLEASQQPPSSPEALPRNKSGENLIRSERDDASSQTESPPESRGLKPYTERVEDLQRASTPTIMIEPNTSLELTEDMMACESEIVTTATDTLLARARRATNPPAPVIIPSDDESLEGDILIGGDGEEGVDAGVRLEGEEGGDGDSGEREEVDGGNSAGESVQKGGERSKGAEPRISHSPSDNVSYILLYFLNFCDTSCIPLGY